MRIRPDRIVANNLLSSDHGVDQLSSVLRAGLLRRVAHQPYVVVGRRHATGERDTITESRLL